MHQYALEWTCEKVGVGWQTEQPHGDMSLCSPLSPTTGTATCPNCEEDEGIKELKFGCECINDRSAFKCFYIWNILGDTACIQSQLASKQEVMRNQTLVDWLIFSAGIHFEPNWDSKDEKKKTKGWRGVMEAEIDRKKEKIVINGVELQHNSYLSCYLMTVSIYL